MTRAGHTFCWGIKAGFFFLGGGGSVGGGGVVVLVVVAFVIEK